MIMYYKKKSRFLARKTIPYAEMTDGAFNN